MAKTATKHREGDLVRVVTRTVTAEDRRTNRYFPHMAGLVGTVENVYEGDEVAIRVRRETMTRATAEVHELAATRMRAKVAADLSEEARKLFTKEEMEFDVHYVLLVQGQDLEAYKDDRKDDRKGEGK